MTPHRGYDGGYRGGLVTVKRAGRALGVVGLGFGLGLALGLGTLAAAPLARQDCIVIGALGGPPAVSDPTECARPTAPASTFKIPHALIALQTGVITPATVVEWDGTTYWSALWQRSHSVDSAIKWSVLPFFQRTARLIGRDRMRQGLSSLAYAADTFDGDISSFWLTGDLAVTPLEQYAFLQRFFAGRLPIDPAHVATVRRALEMPADQITNALGIAWLHAHLARAGDSAGQDRQHDR